MSCKCHIITAQSKLCSIISLRAIQMSKCRIRQLFASSGVDGALVLSQIRRL